MRIALWLVVGALGAFALALLALDRGEHVNAAWMIIAAICTYAVGYRFYSAIIAHRIFALDDRHPTPACLHDDGQDFVPTSKWVLFGHHFAAISGPGPLIGPILAAQFGYLPGTLWIIIGVVLGGAVQDCIILCGSMRRGGRSLGQMIKDEMGPLAGWTSLCGLLLIIVILISVLGLVVVNALSQSAWGAVTLMLTIPIALLMGVWMRWIRPGRVLEASAIGLVFLFVALWAGKAVNDVPDLAALFRFSKLELAWGIIVYGFLASVLPVWMLLAPRDYLSSFLKIGTIIALALGILLVLPPLEFQALMPQFAPGGPFAGGHGPVFSGSIMPFAFITIACGAISGFHALVASGTTPKMISRESHARAIGYGAMLMESFVAIMAMIAACVLKPGMYFAINSPPAAITGHVLTAVATIRNWGFDLTAADLHDLAHRIQETSVLSRTGGAVSLAIGMATIFSRIFTSPGAMAYWYHFAIVFEALFILTTLDAGTRVGRFMFQDLIGHAIRPLGRISSVPAAWTASLVVVAAWGYFLLSGIASSQGGIHLLWPLFGLANQVLATAALCLATTMLVRMGKARWSFMTILPLAWLSVVLEWAGWEKILSAEPDIGFLAKAAVDVRQLVGAAPGKAAALEASIFQNRLDAAICVAFMFFILVMLWETARECWAITRGRIRPSSLTPAPSLAVATSIGDPA